MLPARAWCDLLDTPAFGIRNIGGPGWSLLFSLRGVGGTDSIPHGRVGAEIVCDDTLVQYAAYCALVFFFLVEKDEGGIIRFRLFWRGWRFTHFSPQVSILLSSTLYAVLCAGSGSGKDCFWRLC